jgi:hypothetical protein
MYIDFKAYMKNVDAALIVACGMPSDCLPDYAYRDSFDCNESPEDCAEAALEYARGM